MVGFEERVRVRGFQSPRSGNPPRTRGLNSDEGSRCKSVSFGVFIYQLRPSQMVLLVFHLLYFSIMYQKVCSVLFCRACIYISVFSLTFSETAEVQ